MDSPLSDANSPFAHYQNNWILPEESIVCSQPSLFLLDMGNKKNQGLQKDANQVEKEAAEKIIKAVVSKKESGLQVQNSMKQIKKGNTAKIKKATVSNKEKAQKNEGEKKKGLGQKKRRQRGGKESGNYLSGARKEASLPYYGNGGVCPQSSLQR